MPQDKLLFEEKIEDYFLLSPREFILGHTVERVELPFNLMARLDGKKFIRKIRITYTCNCWSS